MCLVQRCKVHNLGGEILISCERKILEHRSKILKFYKALILEFRFEIPRGKILLYDRGDTWSRISPRSQKRGANKIPAWHQKCGIKRENLKSRLA